MPGAKALSPPGSRCLQMISSWGVGAVDEHADLIKGEMPLFDQVQGFEEAKSRAIAEDVGLQGPAVGRPPASHP